MSNHSCVERILFEAARPVKAARRGTPRGSLRGERRGRSGVDRRRGDADTFRVPELRHRMSAAPSPARQFMALAAAMTLAALIGFGPGAASAASRTERAQGLFEQALRHLRENTFDTRRQAIGELEQATLITPGNPDYELTLARVYYQCGFVRLARERYTRVTQLTPNDADARFGLGQVWRRDWLKYLERTSLAHATANLRAAVALKPGDCEAWLLLVPLLVEEGNLEAASSAAVRAREADPQRPEAMIADAYTSYRLGRVAHADSAFAAGIPRLRRSVRDRYEDIAPVATERDTFTLHRLPPEAQAEFIDSFWKDNDPDLASPESEAKLEYWSRVSHAFFLYYDPRRREWDERGEVYVRYGAPAWADYNPVGEPLRNISSYGRVTFSSSIPANVLAWDYPQLGMRVIMRDRTLSEYYELPVSMDQSMDPVPDPEALERLPDVVVTPGGRGVFHTLPPGVEPRPAEGSITRFESPQGPRLLASFETPGPPDDSLWAEFVVLDSARHEIAREARLLSPSACDPASAQVADFDGEFPPGEYMVGMSVRDRHGRRGLYRALVPLAPPGTSLALSDVAIPCGLPIETVSGEAPHTVRLEPNPNARVGANEPLTAYFEIYHLRADRDGRSRFEYVYTVRSAERDKRIWIQRAFQPRREPAPISASRAEEQSGDMRRQFVRVPVQSLPAGLYRIEITVRDLVAGDEAKAEAQFVRLAAVPGN
jgi:GWxTD domain-containing protein